MYSLKEYNRISPEELILAQNFPPNLPSTFNYFDHNHDLTSTFKYFDRNHDLTSTFKFFDHKFISSEKTGIVQPYAVEDSLLLFLLEGAQDNFLFNNVSLISPQVKI